MTSRFTFRDPAGEIAWQKQLRDRYQSEGTPSVPHLDLKRARVEPVTRRIAKQIILKYEWLGTMPATTHFYGIFFGRHCAGVTCWGLGCGGANMSAHKEWGLQRDELAYLARGANVHWSPTGANSKLVAWSCRLIARDGGKLAIAYSDTDAGEIGTIYQACNWVCVGKGSSTRQWVAPNGRVLDMKLPYDLAVRKGGRRRDWAARLLDAGWREQESNPKHRYVYVLDRRDRALVERVERARQPYPKRASEAGLSPIPG